MLISQPCIENIVSKQKVLLVALLLVFATICISCQEAKTSDSSSVDNPSINSGRLRKNPAEAIKAQQDGYREALRRNPKHLQALIGMGNSFFDLASITENLRDYAKAVGYYKRALAIDPDNLAVRTDMATAYYHLGDKEIAKKELSKVLAANPDSYEAQFIFGVILYQGDKDLVGAQAYFKRVTENAPKDGRLSMRAKEFLLEIETQLQKTRGR